MNALAGEPEDLDVHRARKGDPRAFERLYRAHAGRIHALAVRMAGPDGAEDLTQEIFLRAWDRLSTFRGDARFGTWLHRLAVNWILSRRERRSRREARRVEAGEWIEELPASHPPAGIRLDLERALRTLPERAREVFVLYDVEGYTHEEIAERMGVTAGTSKSQLHRARMLLRERLS